MTPVEIRALVSLMDTAVTADADQAWEQLRGLGAAVTPYLREAFPKFRKSQGRAALLFHAIRFSRESEDAFQMALTALTDKATVVRYRACSLLAYSLRKNALAHLKPLLKHADARTAEDAHASMDAITARNHHYFVDRHHTGRAFWHVNDGDTPHGGPVD